MPFWSGGAFSIDPFSALDPDVSGLLDDFNFNRRYTKYAIETSRIPATTPAMMPASSVREIPCLVEGVDDD
jgi:hypothetical protein